MATNQYSAAPPHRRETLTESDLTEGSLVQIRRRDKSGAWDDEPRAILRVVYRPVAVVIDDYSPPISLDFVRPYTAQSSPAGNGHACLISPVEDPASMSGQVSTPSSYDHPSSTGSSSLDALADAPLPPPPSIYDLHVPASRPTPVYIPDSGAPPPMHYGTASTATTDAPPSWHDMRPRPSSPTPTVTAAANGARLAYHEASRYVESQQAYVHETRHGPFPNHDNGMTPTTTAFHHHHHRQHHHPLNELAALPHHDHQTPSSPHWPWPEPNSLPSQHHATATS